jgi:hypothetical protein
MKKIITLLLTAIAMSVAFLKTHFEEVAYRGIMRFMSRNGLIAYAIPTLTEVKNYSVTSRGLEGIRQSLYDNQLYPTAGQNQLKFFTVPQGQGLATALGSVVGSAKTINDTNMDLAGQLPAGKGFCITSVEVPFYAGSVSTANTYTPAIPVIFNATAAAALEAQLTDVNSFYQSGSLQIYISSKVCLEESPLMRFPPKCCLEIQGAIAAAGTNAQPAGFGFVNGKAKGRPYWVEPPIYFEPSVNFFVALNFAGAVATPSGFNARVGVILDGYLYRLG